MGSSSMFLIMVCDFFVVVVFENCSSEKKKKWPVFPSLADWLWWLSLCTSIVFHWISCTCCEPSISLLWKPGIFPCFFLLMCWLRTFFCFLNSSIYTPAFGYLISHRGSPVALCGLLYVYTSELGPPLAFSSDACCFSYFSVAVM